MKKSYYPYDFAQTCRRQKTAKNGLWVALLLLAGPGLLQAQEGGTQPQDHDAKVYVDEEGKIHLREDQELYLYLSTEKGAQAQKYRMSSQTNPELTNPMPLDGHGVHEITHDDHAENTEVKFQVYADARAPQNDLKLTGAPRSAQPDMVYYGKGLQATIEARDPMSGLADIFLARDGGPYKTYSQSLRISKEKEHRLAYYAVDRVGNASEVSSTSFTVDLTAPSTQHRIQGTHLNNILAPSARLPLSSKDAGAGVERIRYQIDGGNERSYSGAFPLSGLADGEHTLSYYAVDHVDNTESKNTFDFYLDKVAPEVSITVQGDQYQGNYLYVSPRTTYELKATDNKAGVKDIYYELSRQSGRNTYASPFKLPQQRGLHRIDYYATDKVENTSTARGKTVYYDDKVPATRISYGQPQFFGKDTLYINNTTEVTLRRSDAHAGVAQTSYQLNKSSRETYKAPFTIDKEGFYTVSFRSTDRVNNQEDDKQSKVFVDNTAPQISSQFSIEPIGTKMEEGESLPVYPNYVRLYMGATDVHCGTEEISYSMNGGPFRAYSSPRTLDVSEIDNFKEERSYQVTIRAKDKLGNTREKTLKFFIQTDF
jgi:hypothetical protein